MLGWRIGFFGPVEKEEDEGQVNGGWGGLVNQELGGETVVSKEVELVDWVGGGGEVEGR